ncbi:MAG: ECF transporter S component [Clostridiales bacterium]|jgi:uncharacterized membrane protein|nr:ECF transporter S component [Clostridiales bacterium]
MTRDASASKIRKISVLGVFVAIIIIQTAVPGWGYITIGPLSITLIHITVIAGSLVYGAPVGVVLGLIWGLLSMTRAIVAPTGLLTPLMRDPLVSVVPRAVVGLAPAYLCGFFNFIMKPFPGGPSVKRALAYSLCGAAGAVINTVFVLGGIYLLHRGSSVWARNGYPDSAAARALLLGIAVTNGVPEAISGFIIVPAIAQPLKFLDESRKTPR